MNLGHIRTCRTSNFYKEVKFGIYSSEHNIREIPRIKWRGYFAVLFNIKAHSNVLNVHFSFFSFRIFLTQYKNVYLVLTTKYVDYKNIANLLQFIFSIPRKSHEWLLLISVFFFKHSYSNVVTVRKILTAWASQKPNPSEIIGFKANLLLSLYHHPISLFNVEIFNGVHV